MLCCYTLITLNTLDSTQTCVTQCTQMRKELEQVRADTANMDPDKTVSTGEANNQHAQHQDARIRLGRWRVETSERVLIRCSADSCLCELDRLETKIAQCVLLIGACGEAVYIRRTVYFNAVTFLNTRRTQLHALFLHDHISTLTSSHASTSA